MIGAGVRGQVDRDAAEIIATVNRMVDACRLLSEPEPVNHALTQRDEGELHAAAESLHEINAQPVANVVIPREVSMKRILRRSSSS